MKVTIEPYNPNWIDQFQAIKQELSSILYEFNPTIEHAGSTSIPGLAAKPFIDVMVGLPTANYFDPMVEKMTQAKGYVYYKCYNPFMPNRRLFVKLNEGVPEDQFPKILEDVDAIPHEEIHLLKWAHIHIWEIDSPGWIRHIAFRDYLKVHPALKTEYAALKIALSQRKWQNMNEYNEGKNKFIKEVEAKAVAWYKGRG